MTTKATNPKTSNPTPVTETEFRRWSPEEVIAKKLLPYKSARVLKQKCYRHEVHCHKDGGRITFTADDLRRENERTAVVPLAA